jgi:hypothetical protein
MSRATHLLSLAAPHHVALPALDRGERAACKTLALAQARWPAIDADAREGRVEEALLAMEKLARDLWETTEQDPEAWRPTLALARQILYENIRSLAVWSGNPALADPVLSRCAVWDKVAGRFMACMRTEQH